MSKVTVVAWYERPEPRNYVIDVPDDIMIDSDQYNEYITDNLPSVTIWSEDWMITNV